MSIASELTRLQQAKSDLATSIGNKGVTVPASATLDAYPALVDSIQQGGSSLPYDAEIEWIGVRLGAWIEEGDYIPNGYRISIDMTVKFIKYCSNANYTPWFYARTDASSVEYRVLRSSAESQILFNNYNKDSYASYINMTPAANTRYHIRMDIKDSRFIFPDGSVSTVTNNTNHTGNANTRGFILGDPALTRGIELDIYSFTVRDNGVPVVDYIPVRVGQVGYMYDRVSKKLYGNGSSTTSLELGPDVT